MADNLQQTPDNTAQLLNLLGDLKKSIDSLNTRVSNVESSTNTPPVVNKPHESANDILVVYNPDLECDEIDPYDNYSHRDYFQVKWDNRPHRIRPGETRKMPRWLATHFAKHLADHILQKMEMKVKEDTGKTTMLVNSASERPRVLSQIIQGVDSFFEEPSSQTGVEEQPMNPIPSFPSAPSELGNIMSDVGSGKSMELPSIDVGNVPSKAMGVLRNDKPVDLPPEEAPQTVKNEKGETKILPTRRELMEEAQKLDIPITGKENVAELQKKIAAF